jgi:hypothetical protein
MKYAVETYPSSAKTSLLEGVMMHTTQRENCG